MWDVSRACLGFGANQALSTAERRFGLDRSFSDHGSGRPEGPWFRSCRGNASRAFIGGLEALCRPPASVYSRLSAGIRMPGPCRSLELEFRGESGCGNIFGQPFQVVMPRFCGRSCGGDILSRFTNDYPRVGNGQSIIQPWTHASRDCNLRSSRHHTVQTTAGLGESAALTESIVSSQ